MDKYLALVIGGALLLLGGGLHIWTSGAKQLARRHGFRAPVYLCYALGSAALLYGLFPSSSSTGEVLGFQVGGAAALAILVWIMGVRYGRAADRADEQGREIATLKEEIANLQKELVAGIEKKSAIFLEEVTTHEFLIRNGHGRQVGVLAGNLRNVTGIDVWINSENTHMMMSRPEERTISGMIRRLGWHLDAAGHPVDDPIQDELRTIASPTSPVSPGFAVSTGAGALAASHGVKRIVHVASAYGTPGAGYRSVDDTSMCATSALREVDRCNANGHELRTVVIPLFGAGQGGGDLPTTAGKLAHAVTDYLSRHPDTKMRTVYLLAGTDVEDEACRAIFEANPQLRVVVKKG